MWSRIKNLFSLSGSGQASQQSLFYRQWDQLRNEALTPQDRDEIDALFYRHSEKFRADASC